MTKNGENCFNLVRESWVPIAGHGRASLEELFRNKDLAAFGGTPIEKIALLKLALCIAQAAYTPEDTEAWRSLTDKAMAERALAYLSDHAECFWIHGEKPFLQMPAIVKAEKLSYGAIQPMIATGNTTILTQSHIERDYSEAELAVLLVTLMNFALGGKKADNTTVLSPGYLEKTKENGKPTTAKGGPALGFLGYLHSFLTGKSVRETIWLNLLTQRDIEGMNYLSGGLGRPAWENMPVGENDAIARGLRESYLGRLVPLSRFVLFTDKGLHCSEGIRLPSHKEGAQDASVAVSSDREKKALWTNPEQRPWRQLPALLSFFDATATGGFDCRLLRTAIPRAVEAIPSFGLWSGGLRVSSNAGEQYVSGLNDFVESEVKLNSGWLGREWFNRFKNEIEALKALSGALYGAVAHYYSALKADGGAEAAKATEVFWEKCESLFQELVDACGSASATELSAIRKRLAVFAEVSYDQACPRESARQIEAWAAHRLVTYRYISNDESKDGAIGWRKKKNKDETK